jgi:hypothetical protein
MLLDASNYSKGFLMDSEGTVLAGVSDHPDRPGLFIAWMVDAATSECFGLHEFESLESAVSMVNLSVRGNGGDWHFVSGGCSEGGCSGGGCSGNGGCGGKGSCGHNHSHV